MNSSDEIIRPIPDALVIQREVFAILEEIKLANPKSLFEQLGDEVNPEIINSPQIIKSLSLGRRLRELSESYGGVVSLNHLYEIVALTGILHLNPQEL